MIARSPNSLPFTLAKTLLFSLTPTMILLVITEVALRATGAAERCPTYTNNVLWVCDPVLYFRPRPTMKMEGVPQNSAGFRGREFVPKPHGIYRILALGDSCTFGMTAPEYGVFAKEPYPQRLERIIAERVGSGRVEVLNGGAPGYNSYQGVMLLRSRLRGLDPDLITVRFGWNDHLMSPENRVGNAFREPHNPAVLRMQDWLLRTALYRFALRLGMEIQLRLRTATDADPDALPPEYRPNVSIQDYEHHLRRLVALGRARGARVWLLTAPSAFSSDDVLAAYERLAPNALAREILTADHLPSFQRLMEIHDAYNDATRTVAEALDVPLVDMAALYRQHADESLFSMEDVVHPTQHGYDLEAEALYARLRAERIVNR